ncbi:hypothetical protein FS842_002738 [Serendipita sp. 407]|nr:hypothetical protein FS842_002738 [Serendipita sp. 407]
MLCVNKLIWTISRPAPSVKVYDSRLRMNRIDILVCVGLPLLLSPVYAVTSFGRYTITEDFGPWALFSVSLDTWILQNLPITLITIISITYSYRSFRNFYRSRRSKRILDIEPNHLFQHRALSDIQVVRYCSATLVSILGMTFGVIWLNMDWIYWAINDPDKVQWYSQLVLLNNWQYRDQVYQQTRTEMENDNPMFSTLLKGTVFYFSIPSSGIQIFLWFGLGAEARKSYFHWLSSLVELITRTRAYIWLEALFVKIRWRIRPHQMDPENFTPFQLDDVRLEELSTTTIWSDSDTTLESVLPPYPIARLSRPYMSKNSRRVNAQTVSIRIPPPSVLRKESVQRQHARGRNSQLQSIL